MQAYVLRVPFEGFREIFCNLRPLIFARAQRNLLGTCLAQTGLQGKCFGKGIARFLVLLVPLVCYPEIKVATGVLRCFLSRRLQDGQRLCHLTLGHERLPQESIGSLILRMELEDVFCRGNGLVGCVRSQREFSQQDIGLSEIWSEFARLCERAWPAPASGL